MFQSNTFHWGKLIEVLQMSDCDANFGTFFNDLDGLFEFAQSL